MDDLTKLLDAVETGDRQAAERLLPLVYTELRRVAQAKMAAERPGLTLDASALVHEAYLRLVGADNAASFANRRHFFAAAAEAMRRILIERARHKGRLKHGGERRRVDLTDQPASMPDDDLLALDEAMTRLAGEDALAAKVVEMRYFGGLGHEQIAGALDITVYQARQKWTYARAWLRDALAG